MAGETAGAVGESSFWGSASARGTVYQRVENLEALEIAKHLMEDCRVADVIVFEGDAPLVAQGILGGVENTTGIGWKILAIPYWATLLPVFGAPLMTDWRATVRIRLYDAAGKFLTEYRGTGDCRVWSTFYGRRNAARDGGAVSTVNAIHHAVARMTEDVSRFVGSPNP